MHFTRSLLWSSISLLSLHLTEARVANQAQEHDDVAERGFLGHLRQLNPFVKRQQVCQNDVYEQAVESNPSGTIFCATWMNSPPATLVQWVTPTTTTTDIGATSVFSHINQVRFTTTTTTTLTETSSGSGMRLKRAPEPTLKARMDQMQQIRGAINAFLDNSTYTNNSILTSIGSALSSACNCLQLGPATTVTVTSTDIPEVKVVAAYIETQVTNNSTTIVRTVTATTTAVESSSPSFSVTSTSASSTPTPIGQDINCPAANGTTQPIVVGEDVYLYIVYCNETFVNETDVYNVAASSFRDCLDACSTLNSLSGATDQVCHGVNYDGVTCSLRNPASQSDLVSSSVFNAAVLWQVIASGNSTNSTFTTSGISTITPPPVVSGSTTEQSGCSATTATLSNGVISFTSTCSFYSSWWSSFISEATTIYSTEIIGVGRVVSSANGAGGVGAPSASPTSTTFSTATAGSLSTYTIIENGSTVVIVSTYDASSFISSANGTGGVVSPTSAANSGVISTATDTGAVVSPYTSTYASTIVVASTVVYNGSLSSGNATGGIISPSTSTLYLSTYVTTITSVISGATSSASGTGGVSIPVTAITYTIITNGTTIIETVSSAVSGAISSASGTGGIVSPTSSTAAVSTLALNGTTITSIYSSATSGFISSANGTGGLSTPSSPSLTTATLVTNGTTIVSTFSTAFSGVISTLNATGSVSSLTSPSSLSVTTITSNGTTILSTVSTAYSGVISTLNGTGSVYTPTTQSLLSVSTIALNGTTATGTYSTAYSGAISTLNATGGVSTPISPANLTTAVAQTNSTLGSPTETASSNISAASLPTLTYSPYTPPTLTTSPSLGPSSPVTNVSTLTASNLTTLIPSGPSSGFPIPSSNASAFSSTPPVTSLSSAAASSSGYNQSYLGILTMLSSASASATSVPTTNVTVLPLTNSTLTPPSTSVNGTLCTGMSSVSVQTVTVTQAPSNCICGPQYTNGSWPWGTGTAPAMYGPGWPFASASLPSNTSPLPTSVAAAISSSLQIPSSVPTLSSAANSSAVATSSSVSTSSPVNVAPTSVNDLRVEGTNATDTEIQRACNNVGNQIFNGAFELVGSDQNPLGWDFSADSTSIFFIDYASPTQHTPNGGREGRFVSEDSTAAGRLYQPVTLCPNATYQFTAWTRQPNILAECTATFSVGGTVLGSIMPGSNTWDDALFNAQNYTVGPTIADASQDFAVSVQCTGSGNASGQRILDIDDLTLTVVLS